MAMFYNKLIFKKTVNKFYFMVTGTTWIYFRIIYYFGLLVVIGSFCFVTIVQLLSTYVLMEKRGFGNQTNFLIWIPLYSNRLLIGDIKRERGGGYRRRNHTKKYKWSNLFVIDSFLKLVPHFIHCL